MSTMSLGRILRVALIWAVIALAWSAFVIVLAGRLLAGERERCVVIDERGLVATAQGFSVALCPKDDGQPCEFAAVLARDTQYWEGPALLCMPGRGLLRLYLPSSAWPSAAMHSGDPPYTWIDRYKTERGEPCCADKDCELLDPRGIEQRADGYFVKKYGEVIPYGLAKPSEDGHFWICRWGAPVQTKCFFTPYSGS